VLIWCKICLFVCSLFSHHISFICFSLLDAMHKRGFRRLSVTFVYCVETAKDKAFPDLAFMDRGSTGSRNDAWPPLFPVTDQTRLTTNPWIISGLFTFNTMGLHCNWQKTKVQKVRAGPAPPSVQMENQLVESVTNHSDQVHLPWLRCRIRQFIHPYSTQAHRSF